MNHSAALRNAIANQVGAALNDGELVLQTRDGAAVATLLFETPAFDPAIDGRITARPLLPETNAMGGIVAKAELRSVTGSVQITCSVSEPDDGGDITLETLAIKQGQTVEVTSLAYTAPL